MSYRDSAKNRKLKRTLLKMISFIKFSGLNITFAQKISFFGIMIGVVSLFLTWIDSVDNFISGTIFIQVLGITGYIFVFLYLLSLGLIIANKNTLIIKNILSISIKDGSIMLILSIFCFLLSLNSAYIINGFSTFKEGIFFGKGIIFSIIGSIFMITGSIITLKNKDKIGIFTGNIEENVFIEEEPKSIVDEKNNMKLPF